MNAGKKLVELRAWNKVKKPGLRSPEHRSWAFYLEPERKLEIRRSRRSN